MENPPLHEQTKRSSWPDLADATDSIYAESEETKGDLWEMPLAGYSAMLLSLLYCTALKRVIHV